jgi:flagellar biosynthesis protein FliQ
MPFYLVLLQAGLTATLAAMTPVIALLLMIGLATAVFQALFQIEDTAFALLPKIFAMIAIAMFGGFGALRIFAALAVNWISHAGMWVHQPWS